MTADVARPRRRALRSVLVVLGTVLAAIGVGALVKTLWNPSVSLLPPRVERRVPTGSVVTVVLGGDFAPTDAAMPIIRRRGYRYPYLATASIFREADVAFANLESPVTESTDAFWPWKDYIYRVEPEAIEAWQWLGLDVVSLANNHIIDYRARGVHDTLEHLRGARLAQIGAGRDEAEARRPVIFDVGGTKIGLLAYLEHRAAFDLYLDTFAVGGDAGCAQLNRADVEEDVRRLRPLVDVLVVSVHWGDNYAPLNGTQEHYGRVLAELGVDVVAGHHPHIAHPVEWIGRTLVLYSLGNYAWGTPGSNDLKFGLIARLAIRPRRGGRRGAIEAVDLLPIATQNREIHFQPRPLRHDEMTWLDPLIADSRARGTELTRVGNQLRVELPAE
ncbi:MAG: CapA family protein [Deltaproteobacteria bacterium]|nr:CapA family protein [Deltaproteobacteria bacterium]